MDERRGISPPATGGSPLPQFNPSDDLDAPNKKLYAAMAAEFLGLMFFQLCESGFRCVDATGWPAAAPHPIDTPQPAADGGVAHEEVAAFGNGISLAVLVWATANVSGGHLNPAVTLSTMVTGHMHWKRGLLYMGRWAVGARSIDTGLATPTC